MDAISQTNFSKCIFMNENAWISIKSSLKLVPNGPIDNIPALVLIMARRLPGDKPLSDPMVVKLPTHVYVDELMVVCHGVMSLWEIITKKSTGGRTPDLSRTLFF